MSKKYAFFNKFNGAYLGSQFFDKKPTSAQEVGFSNAEIIELPNNFQLSSCKYNFETLEIEEITDNELNNLLSECLLSVKELKLKELDKKYKESQYIFVKNGHTFKVPLRNDDGYFIFKDKVNLASLYGSAFFSWNDYATGKRVTQTFSKEIWLKVGEFAEKISCLNWNHYKDIFDKINDAELSDEEILEIKIDFPEVETIEIDNI